MRAALGLGLLWALFWSVPVGAQQADTIFVYGPGGPYPAIQEAAKVFEQHHPVTIVVTKGPADRWLAEAREKADLIYSGAEFMMQNFVWQMAGKIDERTIRSLYLRPSGILVRKGNPRHIRDFPDLLKPGIRILVVDGAGQTGLWEDMAGKQGDIRTVRAFRRNIVYHAHNSAEARRKWLEDPSIDAWLIWNIWQIANPDIADYVPVSRDYVIYRDCGVALTVKGEQRSIVREFYDFLASEQAAPIFRKWGWITE